MRSFALLIGWVLVQGVSAEVPWPGKTGPFASGNPRPQDARGVPTTWDEASGEHIAWKVKIEGLGHSTPVVGGGMVWLTSATEDGTRQYVVGVRERDGKVLHHRLLFENEDPEPLNNPVNSYASPTCVLTDDALYVHFGTYGTARLDPQSGDVVWQRRDIHARHFRGPGSSPVLVDDFLVLTFDGIDQQFVTALDTVDGRTRWRTDRTTDYGDLGPDGKPKREGDLRKAYSTPAIATVDGERQVVSVGSRAAFGYDLQSGKELWTIRHDDYNAAAQPLLYRDLVIMNTGSRNANLIALRLTPQTRGDVTETEYVAWDRPKQNSRLCFPVLDGERIYALSDTGVVTGISVEDGKTLWTHRAGGNFVASPILANDRLYVFDERGTTTVLDVREEPRVVAENQLAEGGKASPAIAGGALFLRSTNYLYRLAQ